MDKKNTMLLTVIAVATLLVAVVGATFAYFNIQVQNTASNTTVTGKTESVGTVTITSPVPTLKLNISADLMSKASEGSEYYASVGNDYETSAQSHQIVKVAVTGDTGGSTYECKATLTIKADEQDSDLEDVEDLKADKTEATITLNGGGLSSKVHDLKELASEATITESLTFSVKGNAEEYLTTDVKIKNTEADQSTLAGKKLKLTYELSAVTCDTKASAGA